MLRSKSIKGRLIATVVISQALLAAGLLFAGVFYTHRRLVSALDAGLQARAMSVAALVRYTEDATGNIYFDDSLVPPSLDRDHPDFFEVWAERSGLLTRSRNLPAGLEIPAGPDHHWNLSLANVPHRVARVSHVPVLDREAIGKNGNRLRRIAGYHLQRGLEFLRSFGRDIVDCDPEFAASRFGNATFEVSPGMLGVAD